MKTKALWISAAFLVLALGGGTGFWALQNKKQQAPVILPPPKVIPQELYKAFTLQCRVPIASWYRDDSYPPTKPITFTPVEINAYLSRIARKEQNYYEATDSYLYAALEKYSDALKGKKVAVIGSITPWYESIVLYYGGAPTTIEYNKIVCSDPRVEVLTVSEFERNPRTFDAIISISSIEHDGLGRYGDPINPVGDFEAMQKMKAMLHKNGLLFLAVPVGRDRLWWNVHRIYGRLRFPLLIEGWNLIDSFGFRNEDLERDLGDAASGHQPVFVLRK